VSLNRVGTPNVVPGRSNWRDRQTAPLSPPIPTYDNRRWVALHRGIDRDAYPPEVAGSTGSGPLALETTCQSRFQSRVDAPVDNDRRVRPIVVTPEAWMSVSGSARRVIECLYSWYGQHVVHSRIQKGRIASSLPASLWIKPMVGWIGGRRRRRHRPLDRQEMFPKPPYLGIDWP
jgi:hypothetical protein